MRFIPILWCYSNLDLNLFVMKTEDKSMDKLPKYAKFEFLTTVLPRFRGCRTVSTNSYRSEHSTWLPCKVRVSVFLTLPNSCILQTVNYSVLSDYFAQLVYIRRKKQITDVSKFPSTANFLNHPPWTLWPCRWRHYILTYLLRGAESFLRS